MKQARNRDLDARDRAGRGAAQAGKHPRARPATGLGDRNAKRHRLQLLLWLDRQVASRGRAVARQVGRLNRPVRGARCGERV